MHVSLIGKTEQYFKHHKALLMKKLVFEFCLNPGLSYNQSFEEPGPDLAHQWAPVAMLNSLALGYMCMKTFLWNRWRSYSAGMPVVIEGSVWLFY